MVWRRIDLHIHTPASADYQEPGIAFLDILRKAEARGADLIAFTDHNSVRGYANLWREIEDLELLEALERITPAELRRLEEYRRLLAKIRVLPGFEFTATFGFHILAIFPEGTPIRMLEHLLLELNVPEGKLDQGSGEVGATTDVLNAYEIMHNAGALVIPAHVNSTHGVAMQNLPFGGQTKIAFTQSPYIDAIEATDLESTSRRSTARFFNGSKPEYPRRMHVIQGSDAHRLNRDPNRESNLGVCDRMTEVAIPEVSFAALAELFRSEAFNRVRPYRPSQDPYDFVRSARTEGETIVQTFHERPPVRRGRLSPIVRDVAAFSNANGGTIFVGLSASPKEPVLGVPDAADQARVIAEDIERHINPPVQTSIDVHRTDGKQVIVITVPAGREKPYVVAPGAIYIRQEGETAAALRDEIVQLVRAGLVEQADARQELVTAHTTVDDVQEVSEPPSPPRERRARGRRRNEPAVVVSAPVAEVTPFPEPEATVVTTTEPAADVPEPGVPYPRTGVEIVASVERGGVTYHAMRDLRNLKVVHNVTRDSARRLWRYAITQKESHPCDPAQVRWIGERGYWKSYKPRGGDVRYNLVYQRNGTLHIFYGVTDEGMDDAWREVTPARGAFVSATGNGDDEPDVLEPEEP
ncbi:MAG: transcriptional regulator [Chloroflexi bacterium]|nr:MAG: transcriptional regulator [Chloroflexota bacterium]